MNSYTQVVCDLGGSTQIKKKNVTYEKSILALALYLSYFDKSLRTSDENDST